MHTSDHLKLMLAGEAALKAKRFDLAEDYLLAAFIAHAKAQRSVPQSFDSSLTICWHLGRIYRLTARYDESIAMFERSLPLPAAFKELVGVFRFLAKVAQQEDDKAGQREWYRRMFCLATISSSLRSLKWTASVDRLRAFRECHRSLYVFKWTGETVSGDALLSGRDYEMLRKVDIHQA